jgi:PRTRC genetic system protein E
MKINLFTVIAATEILKDKESIDFKIERTGDEFTIMVVPKIAGKKAVLTFSGTPEELDQAIIGEILKPVEKIKGMTSNADSVEITDTEEKKEVKKPDQTKAPKKADTKKPLEEKKVDDNAEQKLKFNQAMLDGETFYNDRKYIEAELSYKKATELFPANTKAKEVYDKTRVYVNALINANILKPREEWAEMEVKNDTEN